MSRRKPWVHRSYSLRAGEAQSSCPPASPLVTRARELATAYLSHDAAFGDLRPLRDLLAPYNIESISSQRIVLRSPRNPLLPELPPEYGYKGGAVRFALAQIIGQQTFPPRDLDLLRVGRRWLAEDTELSARHMPEDFARGFGVELVQSLEWYFNSRDLTINEAVSLQGVITASPICLLDLLGQMLRPCRYRPGSLSKPPELHGRTAMKMLRLAAEGAECGVDLQLVGLPQGQGAADFDIALQLDKALGRGEGVAQRYLLECERWGLFTEIPPGTPDVTGARMRELAEGLELGVKFFRNRVVDAEV